MAATTHLLFDFFGTLVDYSPIRSEQSYQQAHACIVAQDVQLEYDAFIAQVDAVFDEFEKRALHNYDEYTMDAVCNTLLTRVLSRAPSPAEMALYRDTYLDEWSIGVRYIPGVPELLAELSERFVLGLVTNTHHAAMVRRHLSAMGIAQRFTTVVASDEHGRRKPSRCIFDRALALSNGAAETSLYIGDSFLADYRGAASAGMRCLLIDPERRHDIPEGDRLSHILGLSGHLAL